MLLPELLCSMEDYTIEAHTDYAVCALPFPDQVIFHYTARQIQKL